MQIARKSLTHAGQMTGFGFHDAVLVALSIAFDRQFEASFRRTDGALVQLRLTGLGPVGTFGIRNGAIVSDVFAWSLSDVPADSINQPDGAWGVLFGGDIRRPEALQHAVEVIIKRAEFSWMVLIECSYGGSLAALCQEVEVS